MHNFIHLGMYQRTAIPRLQYLGSKFPGIFITGPRQSGKTTLAKAAFPQLPYTSLEDLDTRAEAENDPRGFLGQFPEGAILDEVQRAPGLFSYLQGIMDKDQSLFVLTGSHNFLLSQNINQSLAGRVGIIQLLPLSLREMHLSEILPANRYEAMYKGGYPRLYIKNIDHDEFFNGYFLTYIERDVRLLSNIGDLAGFERFIRLCAARAGQMINFSSLATDTGVSVNTAKNWLSVMEASYLIYLLQPYYSNINKKLVKSPKLYFYDTGLLCFLLNIKKATDLVHHPMNGNIFENLVINEFLKHKYHDKALYDMYYWRDHSGHETDMLLSRGNDALLPCEIKITETFRPDYRKNLKYFGSLYKTDDSMVITGREDLDSPIGPGIFSWKQPELYLQKAGI